MIYQYILKETNIIITRFDNLSYNKNTILWLVLFDCFNFDDGIENAHSSRLMLTGGGYGRASEEM